MVRALWDITRSCFVRLNGPQRTRVVECAVRRRSSHVLHLDISLLTVLLYGDDQAQSKSDELLVRLRDATIGESVPQPSLVLFRAISHLVC